MSRHTPYQQLSEEDIQSLLADQFDAEAVPYGPSGYGRLTQPATARMPMPPPDEPGYTFEAPGGYAESFTEPGTTPEQYAAAKAGAYSAQRPGLSDQALMVLAGQENVRAQRKEQLESTIVREAASGLAPKGRLAELQATLGALGQEELMRSLMGDERGYDPYAQAAPPSPLEGAAPGPGKPTLTRSMVIGPTGKPTVTFRQGPAAQSREAQSEAARTAKALEPEAAKLFPGDTLRQRQWINEQTNKLAGARAGEVKTGGALATEQLPLNEESKNWINPKSGTFADATMSRQDAKAQGYKFVSDKALQATSTARSALTQLDQYEELSKSLLTSIKAPTSTFGLMGNIAQIQKQRIGLWAKQMGGDPMARRLQGMFGTIATIARATGDTANIAVQERDMLKQSVPNEADSLESALAKVKQLRTILREVQKGWGTTAAYEREQSAGGGAAPSRNIDSRTGKLEP